MVSASPLVVSVPLLLSRLAAWPSAVAGADPEVQVMVLARIGMAVTNSRVRVAEGARLPSPVHSTWVYTADGSGPLPSGSVAAVATVAGIRQGDGDDNDRWPEVGPLPGYSSTLPGLVAASVVLSVWPQRRYSSPAGSQSSTVMPLVAWTSLLVTVMVETNCWSWTPRR